MQLSIFSPGEYTKRLNQFRSQLQTADLEGAIILQRVDLLYLTGASCQAALVVSAKGEDRLYVWKGIERIPSECPLEIEPIRSMGAFPEALHMHGCGSWRRIGFEEDVLPVALWKRLVLRTWPEAEFADIGVPLRWQRSVKSPAELELVRESGRILSSGFKSLPAFIREGVPEFEIQVRMESVMRLAGDQADPRVRAFNAEAHGVVASGKSAGTPALFDGPLPQPGRYPFAAVGSGSRKVERNLPVIVDITAGYWGYMTDMTRTYFIGNIPERFREAHDFCVNLLVSLEKMLVPGAIPEELYFRALDEAKKAGWEKNFMNRGGNQVRFIAHGIGMEMDELPVLAKRFTDPLKENTVLAVEPKIVFDDGAVGVEDTLIVRPDGAETVTQMERGLFHLDS